MRPVLTLLGCDLFGGIVEDALPVAYAGELFHNFTLMHDDIMDNAPMRRGMETVHEKFNVSSAILSGDVMLIYGYKFLEKLSSDKFQKVISVFNDTAVKVCEGQQYDMNFENEKAVSLEAYLEMIEYKTAVLLASSLKCGALVAGANDGDGDLIYEFGRNIGMSFQLMDDLLDVFGESGNTGKMVGGDIEENKKTFLLIKALEMAEGEEYDKLNYYLNNNIPRNDKIEGVKQIFENLGIEELTRKEINKYHAIALSKLDAISVDEERKTVLKNYAEDLLQRIQ